MFESNVLKITFFLSSKLLCFFTAFKVLITVNDSIMKNNKKTFICVSFYTADEKLFQYEKFFGEKSKHRDNLIQSVKFLMKEIYTFCYSI